MEASFTLSQGECRKKTRQKRGEMQPKSALFYRVFALLPCF